MLPVQSSAISRKTWGRNWYTILTQSSQCKEYTPLHKYLNHPLARHCLSMSSCLPKKSEEALLNIRCIVRGYHLCRFEVNAGEVFTANKKRGERGNAFKVVNHRGQLGRLQSELVDPLWPVLANISVSICNQ